MSGNFAFSWVLGWELKCVFIFLEIHKWVECENWFRYFTSYEKFWHVMNKKRICTNHSSKSLDTFDVFDTRRTHKWLPFTLQINSCIQVGLIVTTKNGKIYVLWRVVYITKYKIYSKLTNNTDKQWVKIRKSLEDV